MRSSKTLISAVNDTDTKTQALLATGNKQLLINLNSVSLTSMCNNLGSKGSPFTNPNSDPLPNDDTAIRDALQAGQPLSAWCRCFCTTPNPSRINELHAKVNIYNLHILLKQMNNATLGQHKTDNDAEHGEDALAIYLGSSQKKVEDYIEKIHAYDQKLLTAESFKHCGAYTSILRTTLQQTQEPEYTI